MTEKQAAVLVAISAIVFSKLSADDPLRKMLDEVTREMCDELSVLAVPTSHVFDRLDNHGL